jgi:NAD(P)-dependent dehydrogenase (short-subunit alcohol dehydrogenase family)
MDGSETLPVAMPEDLNDKTVLITGAGGGQGGAAALLFASAGANLILCDKDQQGLERAVVSVEAEFPDATLFRAMVDVTSVSEIEAFVSSASAVFETIDVIYNNVGINHLSEIAETTEADWELVHAVNLKSAYFLVKAALPALKRSSGGSIINVSSGAGILAPADGNTLYCSSKGALIALTRAQARELAAFNIRVNCIMPGPIETPMVTKFFDGFPANQRESERSKVLERSLLKRFGTPDEVASMALFLASSEASYITGAIIPVDAGWTAV